MKRVLTLVSMLAALPPMACAQSSLWTSVETVAREEMAALKIPGASLAIVKDGEIVFSTHLGMRDSETKDPVTADTLFRIGSVTKTLTAAAFLRLAASKGVPLDSPAGKYVPGLQPALAGITFEQLLSHRSGLADDGRPWGKQDDPELGNAVRRWSEEVRFDESGRIVSYSNRNYAILGVATENILGRPYPDAMRELLFGPLKMTRTMIRLRDAMTWTVAQGHHGRPGTAASVVRPFTDNAEGWPAGFAFSTATDLARFAAEFCKAASGAEGTQFSREMTSLMSTPRAKLPGLPIEFGLGLRIESMRGTQYLSHGGALPGFGSQLIIVPQHGFGIVVLTNRTAGRLEKTVERAMELGLPLGPKVPLKTKTPIAPSPDDLSSLTGKYRHSDRQILEVVTANGQLSLVDDGEGRPLAKMEDDLFVVGSGTDADEVAFVRTSTGAPPRYLHLNGRAYLRQ